MKWLAAAAGVIVAGAASLVLIGARDDPTAQAPPPPAVASAAPVRGVPAPAPSRRDEPPAGVTLHGVVLHGTQSQALLTVDGQQQSYGVGDHVKGGWSVQAIRAEHVVLANGGASAALDVNTPSPAPEQHAAAAAAPVIATAARLPGFIPGAASPMSDDGASERNRRFLEAVQARRARQ